MFEYFKERRLAALFFSTIMVFPVSLVVVAIVHSLDDNNDIPKSWPLILPGAGLFVAAIIWRRVRLRRRLGTMGRYKSSPLSDDERMKARRKLAVKPSFKK